jgi:hypothetical protein
MAGYFGNIPTPQATQTRDTFTATASQTSFATSGYTVGMLDVYLNGVKLLEGSSADFVASNGSDVVLNSGASSGDKLEVVSFATFESDSGTFTGAVTVGGDLTVDTNTLKVDSSNNRVGIGTSPSHPLHILTSTDGTGVSGDNIWAALVVNAEATDGRSYGLKISAGSTTDQAFAITDHDGSNDLLWVEGNGTTKYRTAAAAGVYGVSITANNSQSDIGISGSGTSTQHRIKFFNTNGQVGAINTSGTATSYNTSSDYRLKENVSYTWDATARLKQLKPARFNFIADADTIVDGFLAHEVETIIPEAVSGIKDATEKYTDEDGKEQTRIVPQGIDQSKLVPLLVKTIQELEARITALEAK